MGKTYRKEKPKQAREDHTERHVDHDHDRTLKRRQIHEVMHHYKDEDFEDQQD